MRLESLESQSASQTPRSQRPTSSSRQKDASKDGRKVGSKDGRCETKETTEVPRNPKTSRASSRQSSRSTRGAPGDRAEGVERVQRPLTPKRHLETSTESMAHKSRDENARNEIYPGNSRTERRLMGQPCYEELELDVEGWLDD